MRKVASDGDYVDLAGIPGIAIDLRYATVNNFTGVNLYRGFNMAFLHRFGAEKLRKAARLLAKTKPGWRLLVLDALRPRSVQRILWNKAKEMGKEGYVADPAKGSVHNYGLALDITLMDNNGKEVDMGTPYDDFTSLSEPRREEEFKNDGRLTVAQFENRALLRGVMTGAGFLQLPTEWWHYDSMPPAEARTHYRIIE